MSISYAVFSLIKKIFVSSHLSAVIYVYVVFMVCSNFTVTKCRGMVTLTLSLHDALPIYSAPLPAPGGGDMSEANGGEVALKTVSAATPGRPPLQPDPQ